MTWIRQSNRPLQLQSLELTTVDEDKSQEAENLISKNHIVRKENSMPTLGPPNLPICRRWFYICQRLMLQLVSPKPKSESTELPIHFSRKGHTVEFDNDLLKYEKGILMISLLVMSSFEVISEGIVYSKCNFDGSDVNLRISISALLRMTFVLCLFFFTLGATYYESSVFGMQTNVHFLQKIFCCMYRVLFDFWLLMLIREAFQFHKLAYHARYVILMILLGVDGFVAAANSVLCAFDWKQSYEFLQQIYYVTSIVANLIKLYLICLTCSDLYLNFSETSVLPFMAALVYGTLMFTRYVFHLYGDKFALHRAMLRDFALYCFVYFCCLRDYCNAKF